MVLASGAVTGENGVSGVGVENVGAVGSDGGVWNAKAGGSGAGVDGCDGSKNGLFVFSDRNGFSAAAGADGSMKGFDGCGAVSAGPVGAAGAGAGSDDKNGFGAGVDGATPETGRGETVLDDEVNGSEDFFFLIIINATTAPIIKTPPIMIISIMGLKLDLFPVVPPEVLFEMGAISEAILIRYVDKLSPFETDTRTTDPSVKSSFPVIFMEASGSLEDATMLSLVSPSFRDIVYVYVVGEKLIS